MEIYKNLLKIVKMIMICKLMLLKEENKQWRKLLNGGEN